MTARAKLYIGAVIAGGFLAMAMSLQVRIGADWGGFLAFVAMTLVASGMKVSLPGVTGTMSVHFLFLLIGIVNRPLPEVIVAGAGATLVQCYWRAKRRPTVVQVLFNAGATSIAVGATDFIYHLAVWEDVNLWVLRLATLALVFFFANTAPVAIVIALTEGRPPAQIWKECYFWCFPFYVVGASVAAAFGFLSQSIGQIATMMGLPVVYVVFRSYGLYLQKLQSEKDHAKQMAALHLRTIEALALAIDAKDHATHKHLERVQTYAMELGRDLGLPAEQLEALQAAALLHDIGKLAVPEHIISKPGRLTVEEFEKMKIHPQVGAEILDRVQFPYPVAPIVRSHHEKWDGTGYPAGLKGEEIPLAARILSAVDCLDALASERPYRRAMTLVDALAFVVSESGRSFDPRVVEVLARRMREMEEQCQAEAERQGAVEEGARLMTAAEPLAGLEVSAQGAGGAGMGQDFLASIAAARHEAQSLYELAQNLGNSLSLPETMSVMAGRLRRVVPYDAMAVYVLREGVLQCEYVTGEDAKLFGGLKIPMGQGLSGWVAENRKPILNGNPSVEPGYLGDAKAFSLLHSALAVPLETAAGVLGVLAVYQLPRDAFSKDHLRILMAVSSKVSVAVENAMKFKEAESSATIDYLTTLPNARSLFLHLEGEMAKPERAMDGLAVMVCDVDGFKQVNDEYGHLTGNLVLGLLATKYKALCRPTDYVARMGGDEFVFVLPGMSGAAAKERMAELQAATTGAGEEACGWQVIGLSVGVAMYPEDGSTAEDLLAEADRRMYRDKQERRVARGAVAERA